MNKKRRTTIIIVSLAAAITLLAVTAYANVPEYEGYEAFKALAKEHDGNYHDELENGTMEGMITVTDNGQELATISARVKLDGTEQLMSGDFIIETEKGDKSIKVYGESEKAYIYDEEADTYYRLNKEDEAYSAEFDEDFRRERWEKGEMTEAQEELLDYIVGDMKDDFEVNYNQDGSETIIFELTEDEMPMFINLMFSAINPEDREFDRNEMELTPELSAKYPLLAELKDLKVEPPELVDNLKLQYVKVALTADADQEVCNLEFAVIVNGDTVEGENHTLQVQGRFEGTQVNGTVVDTPDLEGATVIEIDKADFPCEDEWNCRPAKMRERR